MKSLLESLFDDDLATQPIELDSKAVWDVVFKEIYCKMKGDCIKKGWLMDMNDDTLKISRIFLFNPGELPIKVTLAIYLGSNDQLISPTIRFMRHFGDYITTDSDNRATQRRIERKGFEFREGKFGEKYFYCDTETLPEIITFFQNMIYELIKPSETEHIQDLINRYEAHDRPVPGIIIDQDIMKKLIEKA